jgi:Concanavalin A-like lectin/glucanases superfamily/Immunoglobulin domain/Immunoglobulin I-set domain
MKTHSTYRHSLAATLVAIVTLTTARADYRSTLLSYNPAAYWRLNETATVPIADEAVNIGSLGAAANGFYIGTAGGTYTHPTTGVLSTDGAVTLAGSTGNGLVRVPYSASRLNSKTFTVEGWFNPTTLAGNQAAFSFCNFTTYRQGIILYCGSSFANSWNLRLYNDTVNPIGNITAAGTMTVGAWHHVVVTCDGTNASIYVNGVLGASTSTTTPYAPPTSSDLFIGARSSGVGDYNFQGAADEFAFYTNVLSAGIIAAHYSAATTNGTGYAAQILADHPVNYYRLNEAVWSAPDPSTLPVATNSGYLAASAQGIYQPGMNTGAAGPGDSGLGGATVGSFNAIAGYVDCGVNVPDLSVPLNRLTIMAWAKFSNVRSMDWEALITCGDTAWELFRWNNDQSIGFRFAGTDLNTTGTRPINDGKWHHIAATYDGAQQKIYIDGTLEISANKTGSNAGETAYPILIGENARYPGRVFNGNIGEVAVFTNALTASDVWAVYSASWLAPAILTPAYASPSNYVYEGSAVTLNVTAGGAAPLAYRWARNGTTIPGATANSYLLTTNAILADSGTYAVVITNTAGSVTSSVVLTVVGSPPIIFTQPASIKRFVDSPATFTVVAGGSLPRYYQWKHGTTPLPGGTTASLTLPSVQWGDAGSYSCTISNNYGTTNTAVATLTVEGQFISTVLPDLSSRDRHTALGSDGTNLYFTVGNGGGAAFYRIPEGSLTGWTTLASIPTPSTFNADSGLGDLAYFGGALWTLATASDTAGARGVYHYDIATDTWAPVTPFAGTDGPNMAVALIDTNNILGGWQGYGSLVPLWQISDWQAGTVRSFGEVGGSFSHPWDACVGPTNVYYIKHDYTDPANPGILASVTKTASPAITRIGGMPFNPGMGCAVEYMPGSFFTDAHAQLYVLRGGGTGTRNDGWDWTSATTTNQFAAYDLVTQTWDRQTLPFAVDVGSEMCLVHQTLYILAANSDSQPLKILYLGPPVKPTIINQPVSQTVFQGQSATFSVGPFGGGPFTFQWRRGGASIDGATGNSFTVANAYYTDATNYDVVVSNPAGTTNSQLATLTVLYLPLFANLTNDLVLHLKFDGDLLDSSGRGNNATSNGSPTFVAGKLGQGFHYNTDNTNGIYNYATLGNPADLYFGASQNFSVSYWVRFTGAAVDLPVLCNNDCGEGCIGFYFGPSVINANGGWAWSLCNSSYNGPVAEGTANSINDGQWHNVVSTFDRTSMGVTYLDGVEVNALPISTFTDSLDTLNPVNVGQVGTGSYGVVFGADVDDLGVWLRALSPTEAQSIYMVGQQGKTFDTHGPVVLTIRKAGKDIELVWQTGTLLASTTGVLGTYNPVVGASAPYYRVTPGATPTFYRVRF